MTPACLGFYYAVLKLNINGVQCVLSDCYVNRMVRCCAEMNRLTQVKVFFFLEINRFGENSFQVDQK